MNVHVCRGTCTRSFWVIVERLTPENQGASFGFSGYLWPVSLPRQYLSHYLCPLFSMSVSDLWFSSSCFSLSVTLAPFQHFLAFVSLTPLYFGICVSNSASLCLWLLSFSHTFCVFMSCLSLCCSFPILCLSSPYLWLSLQVDFLV